MCAVYMEFAIAVLKDIKIMYRKITAQLTQL